MILTFAGAALLLTLAFGGKPRRLIDLDIKRLPWMLASFIARDVAEQLFKTETPELWPSVLLAIFTYGLLFYGIWPNLRIPGIKAVGLGSLLNFLVIAANQGRMPVSVANLTAEQQALEVARLSVSINHQPLAPGARLRFLSDLFKWTFLQKNPSMFSVGDVLITAGVAYLIFTVSLRGFRPILPRDKMTEAN